MTEPCIVYSFKMAERIVNVEWQNDDGLQDDLQNYVLQNFKRKEILDFMTRDYCQYAWSLGTLSRRLKYFEIKYVDYDVSVEEVEEVEEAVHEAQDGPG